MISLRSQDQGYPHGIVVQLLILNGQRRGVVPVAPEAAPPEPKPPLLQPPLLPLPDEPADEPPPQLPVPIVPVWVVAPVAPAPPVDPTALAPAVFRAQRKRLDQYRFPSHAHATITESPIIHVR